MRRRKHWLTDEQFAAAKEFSHALGAMLFILALMFGGIWLFAPYTP